MAVDLNSNRSFRINDIKSLDPSQKKSKPYVQLSHWQSPQNGMKTETKRYQWDIVWRNVFMLTLYHILGIYGVWLMFTRAMWRTIVFANVYGYISAFGITAGAHRLWSHRTYKAKLPLKIFLMLCQTITFQNTIYDWVRDHRVHHKFTDTDVDPHNSRRGFFFSHMGWLMLRKHKDVVEKGGTVYMSDIEADPVVSFQRRYFLPMAILMSILIPSHIPWYFWGEDYSIGWFTSFYRYVYTMHRTWLVNSVAHLWGTKPYDKTITSTQNKLVSWYAFGEGWHNYHHVFPWDYKAAELGNYSLNFTTAFLDLMKRIGQAYDLKTPSKEMIQRRVKRTGDGSWEGLQDSRYVFNDDGQLHENIWGWGDIDMKEEDIQNVERINSLKEN